MPDDSFPRVTSRGRREIREWPKSETESAMETMMRVQRARGCNAIVLLRPSENVINRII